MRHGAGRRLFAFTGVAVAALMAACSSSGTTAGPAGTAGTSSGTAASSRPPVVGSPEDPMNQDPVRPGAKRLHFEFGPIEVKAGQNNIDYSGMDVPKPAEDGWITRISPNIRRADGTVPPVDVIHLHHGVWVNLARKDPTAPQLPERFFAAGEEKTIATLPAGYGYDYKAADPWLINYMIHNLFPTPEPIWITYDLDFMPATAPEARGMRTARPIWLDVMNGDIYPVFDAIRGRGREGRYSFPTDAPDAYTAKQSDAASAPPEGRRRRRDGTATTAAPGGQVGWADTLAVQVPPVARNEWSVDRDGVLLNGAVHLHPGGLWGDLHLRRGDERALLFRSEYEYYEPAGAVSWDVSAKATPPDWRVRVNAGDVLSLTATYDTAKASWYESMGIFVLWMADEGEGSAPFDPGVAKPGVVTHGHLPENDGHGGGDPRGPDAADLPSEPAEDLVEIRDFIYGQGDTTEERNPIPTVARGGSITYDGSPDAPRDNGIWHTITACKAPCNERTGIAYPLADAERPFDSGQLGIAGPPTAGRMTWSTPTDLSPGTYTYFCRIHPFMRGAFRVAP